MGNRTRLVLLVAVVALAINFTRFIPSIALSKDITDFALGVAIGLLIGVALTWRRSP